MILTSIPDILDGAGFQIATISICISCIYYTLLHSKPDKLQNKLFLVIFGNILITAICNLISALTKPYLDTSDLIFMVRKGAQYFYFLFHCLLAPLFCFYVAVVTGANYKLKKSFHFVYEFPIVLTFILVLINPFTHWVYYFAENRTFHRNWAEYIIYGVSIIYYIAAVVMILFMWNSISRTIHRIMTYFFIVVTVGTLLQLLFMPMHTELFAEALAMTAIMVTIENEEGFRDSRTRIYNHAALSNDIQRFLKVRKSFYMICIKMQNPTGLMQLIGPANIEKLTAMTASFLATLVPRYSIYYIGTGTFVIVNENPDRDYNINIAKAIKDRFNYSWTFQDRETTFNASVFCVEIPNDLKSYRDIMMLINGPIPMDPRFLNDIIYGSSLNYILRRSQVEEAIINGLDNKSFEVYYQPIYNTSDMTICSGEALLRLHDNKTGDIYPDEFLPIAERNGMIFELGDFVLDEVCKFLNSGIPTEMGIDSLDVNLSVVQCIQSNYADRIIALVSKYDISPSKITFEITESAATTDYAALRDFVTRLRSHGFRFTVDDYGVGYSNVHSILSLDFETIKIDRSILWEAEQSETGRIIMDSSVAMIKRMGKKILITGVETKQQVNMAADYGVEYLQGYYFSNPISQNEFIGILKATQIARFEEQKALAASEAMSSFLANMSHEIRTPINAVLGMDEMILRESTDDRIIEYARTIEGAGRTLLSLINDILDFSKIEAGSIEIIENPYDLSSMLSDVTNMVNLRAAKKELYLNIDVDPSIPDRLYGDEVRIRQIMLNLLNNAVKYTEKGGITLKVGKQMTGKDSMQLTIDVIDTGIGIREEDMGKLFEKFRRLDLNKNKSVEGSGLGLAITHQLLTHMNGTINVESEYGKGTTFHVSIPQKIVESAPIGDFGSRSAKLRENYNKPTEHFTAIDARILVVDDTPLNLMVIKELLKRTRLQIDTAGSGQECLDFASKNPYDVILLDYRMPEMDGIETLQNLKAMTGHPNLNTPVIALTANAIAGSRERFLKEGFTDYITKPISGDKLEQLLMNYLPSNKVRIVHDDEEPESTSEEYVHNNAESSSGSSANDHDTKEFSSESRASNLTGEEPSSNSDTHLDIQAGIAHCGSEQVYQMVLRTFQEEIPKHAGHIRTALEQDDIKRYTIEVHTIKSSARIIGAQYLSKFAEELEDAGDANDRQKIDERTDEFLQLYESYLDYKIGDENKNNETKAHGTDTSSDHASGAHNSDDRNSDSQSEDTGTKPVLTDTQWQDAMYTLKDFVQAMDYDNSMLVIETLDNYTLPDSISETKQQLESAVFQLQWEEAMGLIEGEI